MADAGSYPYAAPIEAYGNGGFRFAGMSHKGSILCLPSGVRAWPPVDAAALTAGDFAPALAERATFSYLLLGYGRGSFMPSPEIRRLFAEAGVSLEWMDTGAACRTYNVLLGEGRSIAAALIAVE